MIKTIPAIILFLLYSNAKADSGIAMSYRSIPAYITENNDISYRTIETAMFTWYMDDTFRGRDKPKSKPIKWLGWLDTRRGAGYTVALNFLWGNLDRTLNVYAADLLIGKRFFVLPHLCHIYWKIGPSLLSENWYTKSRSVYRLVSSKENVLFGMVANIGLQLQIFKGIKVFTEAEFRNYGPLTSYRSANKINLVNKIPFTEREISDHYNEYDRHQGVTAAKKLMRESLRFGIRFTF
tara:strand:+ start:3544 stop:4254 length:711 start_codon:yes stop_codon:yes gene_type:complete